MEGENLDGLTAEETAAAAGAGEENTDVQHQIDRGDFIEEDEQGAGAGETDAGKGEGAGAGEGVKDEKKDSLKDGEGAGGNTDIDALAAVAGEIDEEAGGE